MISYRKADLLDGYVGIRVGDTVSVKAAGPDDAWAGAFSGVVSEVIKTPEESKDGVGSYYVNDDKGNIFLVRSHQIEGE